MYTFQVSDKNVVLWNVAAIAALVSNDLVWIFFVEHIYIVQYFKFIGPYTDARGNGLFKVRCRFETYQGTNIVLRFVERQPWPVLHTCTPIPSLQWAKIDVFPIMVFVDRKKKSIHNTSW